MSALPDVTERERTFFVEAGAGAGKTTALVERIVALVRDGVPITSIAAITFTDAAAAELRHRVRAALGCAGAAGAAGELGEVGAAALDEVDDAPLLTIHAFAQRILSAHAVAAGLPPVLEVRDEVEASIAFDRAWAAFADRLLRDPAHVHTMGAAMVLGLEERHLRALARSFHDQWDLLVGMRFADRGVVGAVPVDVSGDVAALLDSLAPLEGAADGCLDRGDRLCRHLCETVLPFASRLRGASHGASEGANDRAGDGERGHDLLAVLDLVGGVGDLRAGNRGQAPKWRKPTKATVVQLLDAAERERRALLRTVRRTLLDLVAEEVRRFTLERTEGRRADGVLEFHDLLVLTRDLLAGSPGVLAEVRGSVSHLLIDEFQDTDPLQAELALLLGGGEDGRLFFVGDPKQSIYRFRRADLGVYSALRDRFLDAVVPLPTNQRSTAGVIRWVSRVFARLFASGGEGQVRWSRLVAVRPDRSDAGPPVVTFGGAAGEETVASIREREAADVVDIVRRAVGDPWLVEDVADGAADRAAWRAARLDPGDAGSPAAWRPARLDPGEASSPPAWRPARLDDIAILLPTRTALPAIEAALDAAGIPSRIESRSLVWATQEARDLLALLRAVDDPSDQVAVVAALRTPALACSDRDLLDAVAAGLRWEQVADGAHVSGVLAESSPVRRALGVLASYRDARRHVPFTALIERMVRELRLLELGLAGPRPREAWSRVRFVVDQARAFADRERGGGASLRTFVDWAERQADERARALETVVPESDHVAVRITTIHAAKGREFPIVVVAGLSVEGEPYRDAAVVWPRDGRGGGGGDGGRPELRLGRADLGWASDGWDDAKAADAALERQEDDRLVYVACTRARDHLCVSLHHRPVTGSRTSIAARLHAAVIEARARVDAGSLPLVLPLGEDAAPALTIPSPLPATVPPAPLPATVPPAPLSAIAPLPGTAPLAAAAPLPGAPLAPLPTTGPLAATAPPPGAAPLAPLPTTAPLLATTSPPAAPEPPSEPAHPRRPLPHDSPALEEALAGKRCWRDVAVAVPDELDGGRLLEHTIDLVYERDDGALVVVGMDIDPGVLQAQARALARALPDERLVHVQHLQHVQPVEGGATRTMA